MKVDLTTTIPNAWWRDTITLPQGGTIIASATKDGLTGGSFNDKVNGSAELARNLEGSRALEIFCYRGLSENTSISVLNKIERAVKSCMDRDHYKVLLLLLGSDAIKLILKELKRTLLKLCEKYGIKIMGAYGNTPLDDPKTDGWNNIKTCVIGGHDESLSPGVYVGSDGNLIDAELAEHAPFISAAPYNDTQMFFMSSLDEKYLERQRFAEDLSRRTIGELDLNSAENDQVLVYRVCEIRKDLTELRTLINEKKPKAVILVLYHSGTANTNPRTPRANVAKLVSEFQRKGIIFFGITNNGQPTCLTKYETSTALRKSGVIPAYDLLPQEANAKVRHAINIGMKEPAKIIDFVLPDSEMVRANRAQIDALKDLYRRGNS